MLLRCSCDLFPFLSQKMVPDPHLVVGGESRFDLAQGELGEFNNSVLCLIHTSLVTIIGI